MVPAREKVKEPRETPELGSMVSDATRARSLVYDSAAYAGAAGGVDSGRSWNPLDGLVIKSIGPRWPGRSASIYCVLGPPSH